MTELNKLDYDRIRAKLNELPNWKKKLINDELLISKNSRKLDMHEKVGNPIG